MRTTIMAGALALGCGGPHAKPIAEPAQKTAPAEAPVGMLKRLAAALESPKAGERKKAAEEIAKIGPPAQPLQPALKKAVGKEADSSVKSALTAALEKTNG